MKKNDHEGPRVQNNLKQVWPKSHASEVDLKTFVRIGVARLATKVFWYSDYDCDCVVDARCD